MIVSHTHRVIFVRTRKTASTSIQIALGSVAGAPDIVAPIDERNDQPLLGMYRAQNFGEKPEGPRLGPHMTAADIIRHVGQDVWDDYLTVAVDRNPWDRAVSLYYFDTRGAKQRPGFNEWMFGDRHGALSNYPRYCLKGAVAVNRLLRYETLSDTLPRLWREIGVNPPQLVRAKSQYRPASTRDWRALYDDKSAARVATICEAEIKLFGYKFDDPAPQGD